MDRIYLDNNATTRPTPEVCAAVAEAHESLWANPSSVHRFGQQVRQRLELARASVANLIGTKPREIVLTSGGTEAIDLAIRGLMEARSDGGGFTVLTTGAEHAAVRELCERIDEQNQRGRRAERLDTAADGTIDVGQLRGALADLDGEALVSVQWANNETGVIQPLTEVADAVAAARQAGKMVWLHTDATQAVGKLPVDVGSTKSKGTDPVSKKTGSVPVSLDQAEPRFRAPLAGGSIPGVDLLTFAGHKFHGPKGVGGLWVKRGVRLRAQQFGGPQEMERRGGTENVPGILGLGVAAEQAAAFLQDAAAITHLAGLRDRLENRVQQALCGTVDVVVNSSGGNRLWNTTNLGFTGLEAEAILLGLSERGVCASAGAACSSGSLDPSPVLRAMGVPEAVAHGSIRLSLSRFTTEPEIDQAAEVLIAVVERLARVMPM